MIYDQKTGRLYADDGEFLKTVYCPLALQAKDLLAIRGSLDRLCPSCNTTIRNIDSMTDEDMRDALDEDEGLCVFATPDAKHITVLAPVGHREENTEGLPVIRTARGIEAMEGAYQQGYRLVIKKAGESDEGGQSKYQIRQNTVTSEIEVAGDFRAGWWIEEDGDWRIVANWFFHDDNSPFPYAAYLVPRFLRPGDRVFLEDLIKGEWIEVWNQGNGPRRLSGVATWNGTDSELEEADRGDLPQFVG